MPVTLEVPKYYRPNVGLMLIAADRRVFVGRRINQPDAWQMPQGGVDGGETPIEAACRELREEVGTTQALLLRETRDWITYDVPDARPSITGRPLAWPGAEMVRARFLGQGRRTSTSPPTNKEVDVPGVGARARVLAGLRADRVPLPSGQSTKPPKAEFAGPDLQGVNREPRGPASILGSGKAQRRLKLQAESAR
jgi:putative (di)nucleoside polyphosphate hydrolase